MEQTVKPPTRDELKAFWEDYKALVEKHGLLMSYDRGCVACEVTTPCEMLYARMPADKEITWSSWNSKASIDLVDNAN
jgi:hypothetical protein